ncbi:MAG: VTT domain-containing protein [Clostridia bacterium]|nr:VTT domain-containing protein [Clostridia bacterium]
MQRRTMNRRRLMNFTGVLLIIVALALLALTMLMQVQQFAVRYDSFLQMLADFEDSVAAIPDKGVVILAILLLYLAKSVIPIPTSAVCVIAGMVFQTPLAVIINVVGYIGLITIKYFWGKRLGSGFIYKALCKYENIERILTSDAAAKDGLLAAFRVIPVCPINTISQIYGAMEYDYYKYIFLSVLGFLPRIISYSMVGRHVYNPFSLAFMLPLVIIFMISGFAIIGVNGFIEIYNKRIKTNTD